MIDMFLYRCYLGCTLIICTTLMLINPHIGAHYRHPATGKGKQDINPYPPFTLYPTGYFRLVLSLSIYLNGNVT